MYPSVLNDSWQNDSTFIQFQREPGHKRHARVPNRYDILRIEVREDGLSIDQIVLSPAQYLTASPGAAKNDLAS